MAAREISQTDLEIPPTDARATRSKTTCHPEDPQETSTEEEEIQTQCGPRDKERHEGNARSSGLFG